MTKILHISDWHGRFYSTAKDFDLVVCSGDMMPNVAGREAEQAKYQEGWIQRNMQRWESTFLGRPVLWVSGNHCYFDPCPAFAAAGIAAVNIDNKRHKHDGLWFYGVPYVPYFFGGWNYELDPHLLAEAWLYVPDNVDVMVAHCPPYGHLDATSPRRRIGSAPAADWHARNPESWFLCGHVHESEGLERRISNAAQSSRVLCVSPVSP